jgi:hypothetical protein
MFKDKISHKSVHGHILIRGRKAGGEWEVLEDRKNALVANAQTIIAKVLGGTSSFKLDRIQCLKTAGILATETVSVSYPATDQVKFESTFSEASFNDTLDQVKLQSLDGGDFSSVTGLAVSKSNLIELNIQWTLEVV